MIKITLEARDDGADWRIESDDTIREGEIVWAVAHLDLAKKELLSMLKDISDVEVGAEKSDGE